MSRFTDHLGLQLLEDSAGRAILRGGRCQWLVYPSLTYAVGAENSLEVINVPGGTITDLASIPRLVSGIFPPDGPWAKAAVVHDYLYSTRGLWGRYTREESDAIFHEAMGVVGVPAWRSAILYAAVRLGGARGWGS